MDFEQTIIQVPQAINNSLVDLVIQQFLDIVKQSVVQFVLLEDVGIILRKSTRIKKLIISRDYIMYLQEANYNFKVKDDTVAFSQVIDYNKSILQYNSIKKMR